MTDQEQIEDLASYAADQLNLAKVVKLSDKLNTKGMKKQNTSRFLMSLSLSLVLIKIFVIRIRRV